MYPQYKLQPPSVILLKKGGMTVLEIEYIYIYDNSSMFSMAKDTLEDSILPRAHTSTGANRAACFAWVQYLIILLPKKRHSSVSQQLLPSSLVLNISLISAITGPKFSFYKDVTTTCKNGVPFYLTIYIRRYIYVCVNLYVVKAKHCALKWISRRCLVREIVLRKLFCWKVTIILLSDSARLKNEVPNLAMFRTKLSNKHISIFIIKRNMGIFTLKKIKHKSFTSIFTFFHIEIFGRYRIK